MSELGDWLRDWANRCQGAERMAFEDAAQAADEHDAAQLARSAEGKGPHAAAALRWAAAKTAEVYGSDISPAVLTIWAEEAER
jgi:hypothetical protein